MTGDRPNAETDGRIGVGVIGLGFIGATHVRAYGAPGARDACRVVAVCDQSAERLTGRPPPAGNFEAEADRPLFDPGEVATHADAAGVLADPRVELVSVCTHTDTHVDLAIAALDAGKHVLVEKPVALRAADVRRLADHARASGRLCVPAMCMRHWPGWDALIGLVRSGRHGSVLSARFERVGAPPGWSSFYADAARSGDALFDLHIHDVDMVHACFGAPTRVHSFGRPGHVSSVYECGPAGAMIVAEGAWLTDPGAAFRMRYVVEFEGGVAEFDLGKTPPMSVKVRGEEIAPELESCTGWEAQAAAVVRAIVAGDASGLPTLDDAVAVTQTLEAELESLGAGRPVKPARG